MMTVNIFNPQFNFYQAQISSIAIKAAINMYFPNYVNSLNFLEKMFFFSDLAIHSLISYI